MRLLRRFNLPLSMRRTRFSIAAPQRARRMKCCGAFRQNTSRSGQQGRQRRSAIRQSIMQFGDRAGAATPRLSTRAAVPCKRPLLCSTMARKPAIADLVFDRRSRAVIATRNQSWYPRSSSISASLWIGVVLVHSTLCNRHSRGTACGPTKAIKRGAMAQACERREVERRRRPRVPATIDGILVEHI